MYKLCKSEQSARRQRELEQQLLAMMNTVGFEQITIQDFCEQAGIPRKAFYRYFSSKEGALHALLDHTLLEMDVFALREEHWDNEFFNREMQRFFRFWQRQKPLLDGLQRSGLSDLLVKRTIACTLSSPAGPADSPGNQYTTIFLISGFMSMVLFWHKSGYQLSLEEISEIGLNMLVKPTISQFDP